MAHWNIKKKWNHKPFLKNSCSLNLIQTKISLDVSAKYFPFRALNERSHKQMLNWQKKDSVKRIFIRWTWIIHWHFVLISEIFLFSYNLQVSNIMKKKFFFREYNSTYPAEVILLSCADHIYKRWYMGIYKRWYMRKT